MDVIFRLANIADVPGIIQLCNECFEETTDIEFAKKEFKKTENDENQIYLVGIIDDKIVAHTKITIVPTCYESMGNYAILNHVCVKPDYRRHNLGTRMLTECESICRECGCKDIKLWSMNFRQAAHACYKNFGFNVEDAKFFDKKISK